MCTNQNSLCCRKAIHVSADSHQTSPIGPFWHTEQLHYSVRKIERLKTQLGDGVCVDLSVVCKQINK